MSLWRPRWLHRRARVAWGLDARELAWRPAGDAVAAALRAAHAVALPQALAQITPGTRVDVIAGADIAVHWLQTPPASVASLDELRLVAAARCAHLHGGAPTDWWVAADWNASAPFVCAAVPYSLVTPLQQKFTTAGVAPCWHTAWGVTCGSKVNSFPAEGWSALRSPSRVLLWHCRDGRVTCMSTHSVAPGTGDEEAKAQALRHIRIEGLRDSSLASEPLHWVTMAGALDDGVNEAVAALRLGVAQEGWAA